MQSSVKVTQKLYLKTLSGFEGMALCLGLLILMQGREHKSKIPPQPLHLKDTSYFSIHMNG